MWTARILLIVLLLLSGGGWFDTLLFKREKIALLCAAPVVIGLSFLPTLRTPTVRLCFAPCALALLIALLCPTDHPLGALFAALFGGFVGWKVCDVLPLFPEQGLLIAVPALLFGMLFCRDVNAKALAVAAAPFVMLLFQMIGDYTLFCSAVLELGTGDALTAQSSGFLALLIAGLMRDRIGKIRRRLHAPA
jgi:hypothetical protein